jgi:glycerophosphoryl diester phosphodiesterase
VLRLAHRGDHEAGIENSLPALLAASGRPGVDGVEFDVRLSADRVPVLCHDPDLHRTHGIDRQVGELLLAELEGVGIASLASVLDALPPDIWLDLDLKEDVVAVAAPLLVRARGESPDRASLSSFDPTILFSARRLLPRWPRWVNAHVADESSVAAAWSLGGHALSCHYSSVDSRSAKLVSDAGLAFVAWTVTRRPTFRRLERLGVFAACVEGPALGP